MEEEQKDESSANRQDQFKWSWPPRFAQFTSICHLVSLLGLLIQTGHWVYGVGIVVELFQIAQRLIESGTCK